jgi:perosamine synthetase
MKFIPVCEPLLAGHELKYVSKCVQDNWISSSGDYLKKFESDFAKAVQAKHATAVTNGTAALHLACAALGIKKGDEVIIPDFTMIASAFAVCYTGATPVFVDSYPGTWNMDPKLIEEKITPKTRAIMVVHIFGQPVDMDPIVEIARKHDLKIIEDAAQAHGAEYKGRRCGSLADVACFSLFANKVITTGEGGIVVTDDDGIFDKLRYFKNLAFPLDGNRTYIHEDIGFNYRMPNTLAAIGLAQVEKMDDYAAMRIMHGKRYEQQLALIPEIQLQEIAPWAKSVYWMFGIVLDASLGITRNDFMAELAKKQIDSRRFFYPMHRQPALLKFGCHPNGDYPVSDHLAAQGLYLPSGSGLSDHEIDYVCQSIGEVVKKYR